MSSLDYKLADAEKRDLISSCSIKGERNFTLKEISSLPYGYMLLFQDKEGHCSGMIANIYANNGKKVADVLPDCGFAARVKGFIEDYLNQK